MRLEAYKVAGVLTGPLVVAGFALSLRSPRSDPRGNRMLAAAQWFRPGDPPLR
jgi:hypothetical protein